MSSGSTDGAHSRNTVRRRRLLDDLEQGVGRALGQPVGVLDHHDLPAAGAAGGATRSARCARISATPMDRPSGMTRADIGVGARHRRRTGAAVPAPGHAVDVHCSAAAKHSAATDRPEPGGPVNSHACVMVPVTSPL